MAKLKGTSRGGVENITPCKPISSASRRRWGTGFVVRLDLEYAFQNAGPSTPLRFAQDDSISKDDQLYGRERVMPYGIYAGLHGFVNKRRERMSLMRLVLLGAVACGSMGVWAQ